MRGDPKKPQIYLQKIMYLFLNRVFKLQSPPSYSPSDTMHLTRCFFRCSKQFSNCLILMPFSAFAIFCFTSSTSAKCFCIQWNKQTKSHLEWDWVNREGGAQRSSFFGQKLLNTQHGVGRCTNGQMHWKSLPKKKIHQSQTQPLTTTPADTLIQTGS